MDSISNNARLEDLLKIKKSALDSIVQVLLPISEFVTSLQSNQDKVTKARKQREQILPMLSDDVKSLSSLIGEHTSRTTLMLR